ncbi:hypothetical protein Poly30_42980 [Planctomycetes bacterium Poly30]|uniref:Bacterial type II and III secretion system protein n=1 Tax=Saltatorellus ferox TaxID=2528018 RepID=A0A518EXC3_9BACT|nr:hypothetical protein Poly30_42980 [Planctomycetes bacterium Poly30]
MRIPKTALALAFSLIPLASSASPTAPIWQEPEQVRVDTKKASELVLSFYRPETSASRLIGYSAALTPTIVMWKEVDSLGFIDEKVSDRFVLMGDTIAVQDFPEGSRQAMELLRRLDQELKPSEEADASTPEGFGQARVRLQFLDTMAAVQLLQSSVPGLQIGYSDGVPVLTLGGATRFIDDAKALIEEADRPLPQVLLHWSLIEAVEPEDMGMSEPASEEIGQALAQLAPGKVFRKSGDFLARGTAGANARFELNSSIDAIQGTSTAHPGQLLISGSLKSWSPAVRELGIDRCAIEIHRMTTADPGGLRKVEQLMTGLSIRAGETTVVGSIGGQQVFIAVTVTAVP